MTPMSRFAVAFTLSLAATVDAVDVEGVLPASLDQPRVYIALSREANGKPLSAKGDATAAILDEILEGKKKNRNDDEDTRVFAIDAFLDTGASGVMLSKSTADGLGVKAATYQGKPVTYYDVGVAGREAFAVTEPFFIRAAPYSGTTDGDNFGAYAPVAKAAQRVKIHAGGGMLDLLTGGVDVAGMPVMVGRVMLVDCRPLSDLDKLKTSIVAPGSREIPKPDVVVPLTYVDFDRFTQLEPAGAPGIATGANPLIGPNPFDRADKTPPVTLTHQGKTTTATMLLDTGAAASMLSTAKAKALGIEVVDGKLTNIPADQQFTLPIGGIGGTKDANGFFVDALVLPAKVGDPVRYVKAPLLVLDVSVTDEKTKETYTLDGIVGMNYLVASASVSTGLSAGVDDIHDGAFEQFYIDHASKVLGLKLKH